MAFIECLKPKYKDSVWSTIETLKKISTGFPIEKTEWDNFENELKKSMSMFNKQIHLTLYFVFWYLL